MKLSSLIVAAIMAATVEGKHKKNGAKASKNNGTGGGTSFVGFGGKASKGAKGGSAGSDNNWWSPTKDKFDVCAVANPIENQIEILGGDQSPGGVEHAYAVYGAFADAVKGYNSGGKFCNTLVGARFSTPTFIFTRASRLLTRFFLSLFLWCSHSLIER
jgi:hypothetical protein